MQAFLDIYTIREELGSVNGLTITMVGDLKNGRTVHSLVKLLSLYSVSINFVSPASLSMPESVKAEAIKAGIPIFETTSLASVIGSTDVLYVTRVQQERFENQDEYLKVKDAYVINNELLSRAKPHCIVLHPLPRNAEIDPEVDVSLTCPSRFHFIVTYPLLPLLLVRPKKSCLLPSNETWAIRKYYLGTTLSADTDSVLPSRQLGQDGFASSGHPSQCSVISVGKGRFSI